MSGAVVVLKTGANVKALTVNPNDGRVYAMNRGPGTISVIDPDTDAVIDTLTAERGSLTALNPATNRLYVSAFSTAPATGLGVPGIDSSGQVWRLHF